MRLVRTRDSVAMGDDATAPNPREVDLPEPATLGDLAGWFGRHGPQVSVHGGSTWAVRVDGEAVAVLTDEPRVLLAADPGRPVGAGAEVHLDYLLAQDPEATLALVHEDPRRRGLRFPRG